MFSLIAVTFRVKLNINEKKDQGENNKHRFSTIISPKCHRCCKDGEP